MNEDFYVLSQTIANEKDYISAEDIQTQEQKEFETITNGSLYMTTAQRGTKILVTVGQLVY